MLQIYSVSLRLANYQKLSSTLTTVLWNHQYYFQMVFFSKEKKKEIPFLKKNLSDLEYFNF